MSYRFTVSVFLCLTILVGVGAALAGPQARVGGTVVNSSGEPIPNATITVTSAELPSYSKTTTSNDEGEFKVLILDATKTYLFTVNLEGYLEYNEEIKVAVGTTDNDFTFELSTEKEKAAAREQKLMEEPGYKEFGEGRKLLKEGKTVEARARFEEALAAMPDFIEALEAIAGIDYDSGDNELALASATACLEEDDESYSCLAVAANAASDLGKTELRDEYMARYQALNPDDPATLFNQAAAFLNKMDDDSARPLLEGCLSVDPEFEKCLFEYGMLLLRTGDLEGAKAQLEKYLEVAPDGPDAATASETVKYL